MPLVKKRLSIAAGATSDQVLAEQPMNTSIQEPVLWSLRRLIRQEAQLLTLHLTSPSTMLNLRRMRVYRRLLLVNRLGGTIQDTYSMTWSLPDKCVIDQLSNLKTAQQVQEQ